MSPAKLSRLERGERGLQINDIRALCVLYSLPSEETSRILALARASRQPGWWTEYADLDDAAPMLYGLEAAAKSITGFQSLRIPGLLQTERYSRALVSRLRPGQDAGSEWVENRVSSRRRRQSILDITLGKTFTFILDESSIRRTIGSANTMAEQVRHLVVASQQPNVTIHLIPFERGAHPGLDGSFTFLTFDEHFLADTVFVEGLAGSWFFDEPSRAAAYSDVIADLLSIALDPERTRNWLMTTVPQWEVT